MKYSRALVSIFALAFSTAECPVKDPQKENNEPGSRIGPKQLDNRFHLCLQFALFADQGVLCLYSGMEPMECRGQTG